MIAAACDEGGVVAVDVAEGQRNDAVLAAPVPAEAKAAVGRVDEVLADEAFDCDAVRGLILDDSDALPVIPNRVSRGGPWPRDDATREAYKERNRAERGFGKAKRFRGFATRYDKLKDVYLFLVPPTVGSRTSSLCLPGSVLRRSRRWRFGTRRSGMPIPTGPS